MYLRYCLSELGTEPPDDVISMEVKGIRVIFPDGTEKCLSEHGYVLELSLIHI